MGDFRPKLSDQIPRHIIGDAETYSTGRGPKTAEIAGMIKIAQGLGTHGAEPLRVVGHPSARVAACNKAMGKSVPHSRLRRCSLSQPVVTRVLAKESWVEKHAEEVAAHVVQVRR